MKSEIILLLCCSLSPPPVYSMLRENPCEIISILIKADAQIRSEKYLEGKVFAFSPWGDRIQKKT